MTRLLVLAEGASAVPVLQDIGLDAIRSACPHFDSWLTRLERLGGQ